MSFSTRLLAWYDVHGRRQLPWQQRNDPYLTWVSEIMLQQTRVATVIPYFERFVQRFPDVASLAQARQDEVLAHWSGLGYYARARNLHRAARQLVDEYRGELPMQRELLETLPGIGRSTAAAIVAFNTGRRETILDGNVKRVLARHAAIDGWPGKAAVLARLWSEAEARTPVRRVADYTQAIMDLGSMVCTRGEPDCAACPVSADCMARQQGSQCRYPGSKPRKALPVRATCFLMLRKADGGLLLRQRPPSGVWGGLWGFPECDPEGDVMAWCEAELGVAPANMQPWSVLRHTFSHFHLDIHPLLAELDSLPPSVQDAPHTRWVAPAAALELGIPAPVARLLERVGENDDANG